MLVLIRQFYASLSSGFPNTFLSASCGTVSHLDPYRSHGPTKRSHRSWGATAGEGLNPELFTGIVQGVLSTMMGSLGTPQNETESIAQFIQRLSQTSNIFTPGTGDAMGELFGVNAFPFSSFRFYIQAE